MKHETQETMNINKNNTLIENPYDISSTPTITEQSNASYLQLRSLNKVPSFQFPGKMLSLLEKHKIPLLFMTSSSTSLSMIVKLDESDLPLIRPLLSQFAQINFEKNISVVSITGETLQTTGRLERPAVEALSSIPIFMISHENSNHSLFMAIYDKDLEQALYCLKKVLF